MCLCFVESSEDYVALVAPVRFGACDIQRCVDITITDDSVVEQPQSFTVSLISFTPSQIVTVSPNSIQFESYEMEITVIDDDGMFIPKVTCSTFCTK